MWPVQTAFDKPPGPLHSGHLIGTHFLLSLSFVGQLAPSFFSLFIIFLIRNFLPLLHFLEQGVQGDHPVMMQSLVFSKGHLGSLHLLHFISDKKSGQGFPPGSAFCRIVRDRNRPPRLQVPLHSLHADQGDNWQFCLGVA